MRRVSPLIGCLALACCVVASAQTDRPTGASSSIASVPPYRVSDDLATLTMQLPKLTYKRGELIRVTLILTAGSKGAYFPAYFGEFNATCARGFSADIVTDKGTDADPTIRACMTAQMRGMDSSLTELSRVVHLAPAETRTSSTVLQTRAVPKGSYSIIAEYLSYLEVTSDVSKRAQADGLMVEGRVIAKPVPIVIH
jgi:hypothetical protein